MLGFMAVAIVVRVGHGKVLTISNLVFLQTCSTILVKFCGSRSGLAWRSKLPNLPTTDDLSSERINGRLSDLTPEVNRLGNGWFRQAFHEGWRFAS